jgi:hypothetical protein
MPGEPVRSACRRAKKYPGRGCCDEQPQPGWERESIKATPAYRGIDRQGSQAGDSRLGIPGPGRRESVMENPAVPNRVGRIARTGNVTLLHTAATCLEGRRSASSLTRPGTSHPLPRRYVAATDRRAWFLPEREPLNWDDERNRDPSGIDDCEVIRLLAPVAEVRNLTSDAEVRADVLEKPRQVGAYDVPEREQDLCSGCGVHTPHGESP